MKSIQFMGYLCLKHYFRVVFYAPSILNTPICVFLSLNRWKDSKTSRFKTARARSHLRGQRFFWSKSPLNALLNYTNCILCLRDWSDNCTHLLPISQVYSSSDYYYNSPTGSFAPFTHFQQDDGQIWQWFCCMSKKYTVWCGGKDFVLLVIGNS